MRVYVPCRIVELSLSFDDYFFVLNTSLQLRNIRRQVQEGLRQMLKKILLHQEDEDKDENDTGMLKRRLQILFSVFTC